MASKSAKEKSDAARIRAAITRAYKSGFQEGKNEGSKRLNTLRIANGYLWRELTKLDEHEPEGVWLSTAFAERLAAALQKRHQTYARDIRRQIKSSNQKLEKLLEILDGCKDYK